MNVQQWMVLAGAAAGTLGSITTAFSVNRVVTELNIARKWIALTTKALATNSPSIPVAEGLDERFERASKQGKLLLWLGVALLAGGFILSGLSVASS